MGLFSFFSKGKSEEKKSIDDSRIVINADKCGACQRCVSVCPNNNFLIVEDKSSLKEDYICRDCKVCIAACPNDCIKFS